jgi:hypothetical protein
MNKRLTRALYHPTVIVPLLVLSRMMAERDFNLGAVAVSLAVLGAMRLWQVTLARLG